MKELLGQKFGRLTVIRETEKRDKCKRIIWECKCDCGNFTEVCSSSLLNGSTLSCGCLLKEKKEQHKLHLEGKKFGDLIVIEQIKSNNNYTMWKCKCICGKDITVRGNNLIYGNSTNCGCKRNKKVRKINYKNLIGKTFGKLMVIKETEKRSDNGNIIWECKCKCGRTTFIDSGSLLSGNTKSCGCLQSQGENKISQILKDNNLKFVIHYSFSDCKDKRKLPFDFFVENTYLIEYDGYQHYSSNGGWNSKDHYELTKKHDTIKNNYCKEKSIPLIRIPFWHFNDLSINDLKVKSSKFLK